MQSVHEVVFHHTDGGEHVLTHPPQADDRVVTHVAGLADARLTSRNCSKLDTKNDLGVDDGGNYHDTRARELSSGHARGWSEGRVAVSDLVSPKTKVAQLRVIEARE